MMPNRLGPTIFFPGWTEWQIEQYELNTDLPAAGSAAFAGNARTAQAEKHVTTAASLRGISLLLVPSVLYSISSLDPIGE
jgi:hypothetical protein